MRMATQPAVKPITHPAETWRAAVSFGAEPRAGL